MPRKEYILKNRYCRRSKLSEQEFLWLVDCYFHELLFASSKEDSFLLTNPRDHYGFIIWLSRNYHEEIRPAVIRKFGFDPNSKHLIRQGQYFDTIDATAEELNLTPGVISAYKAGTLGPPSGKTVNNYFKRLSQYLWDKFVENLSPEHLKEDAFDDILNLLHGKIDQLPDDKIFNMLLIVLSPKEDKKNVAKSIMYHLLSNRSKAIKGFKKETFHLEYIRAYFICSVIKTSNIQLNSLYSVEDEEKFHEILERSTSQLLTMLENNPM